MHSFNYHCFYHKYTVAFHWAKSCCPVKICVKANQKQDFDGLILEIIKSSERLLTC